MVFDIITFVGQRTVQFTTPLKHPHLIDEVIAKVEKEGYKMTFRVAGLIIVSYNWGSCIPNFSKTIGHQCYSFEIPKGKTEDDLIAVLHKHADPVHW